MTERAQRHAAMATIPYKQNPPPARHRGCDSSPRVSRLRAQQPAKGISVELKEPSRTVKDATDANTTPVPPPFANAPGINPSDCSGESVFRLKPVASESIGNGGFREQVASDFQRILEYKDCAGSLGIIVLAK